MRLYARNARLLRNRAALKPKDIQRLFGVSIRQVHGAETGTNDALAQYLVIQLEHHLGIRSSGLPKWKELKPSDWWPNADEETRRIRHGGLPSSPGVVPAW